MTLTPTSLLSCLTSSAMLAILSWIIMKNDFTLRIVGRYICVLLALVAGRMLMPFEFKFTITLFSRNVLTRLRDLMVYKVGFGSNAATIGQILMFIWIAGAVSGVFLYVGKYIYFMHVIRRCPGYYKYNVDAVIGRINRNYRKSKEFKVLLVSGIQTPAITGLLHPKILMPEVDYSEKEIYYILCHEMLHYYRHDLLVKVLCEFLCIIYWWNPVVFLLRKLVARVLELRVDFLLTFDFSNEEKIDYMECIVKSMKAGGRKNTNLVIPLAMLKRGIMKQRFNCIWKNHWIKKGKKGILIVISSCLLFLISVSFVVEPWYEMDMPGIFDCPEQDNSYLLEKDGYYEIYVENEKVGEVSEITETLTGLKVYKNKEDLSNEK